MEYIGKYIQDFTYLTTETINLDAEIVLNNANLDLCSLSCVDADGFDCKSFDYCPATKTCLLNSQLKQVTKTKNGTVPTDSCAHYKS